MKSINHISYTRLECYLLCQLCNHWFNCNRVSWLFVRCFQCTNCHCCIHAHWRKIPLIILLITKKVFISYDQGRLPSNWLKLIKIQKMDSKWILTDTCKFLHMAIILSKSVLIARKKWSDGLCMIGHGNPAFEKCYSRIGKIRRIQTKKICKDERNTYWSETECSTVWTRRATIGLLNCYLMGLPLFKEAIL